MVAEAFAQWAAVSGLEFQQVRGRDEQGGEKADIEVSFANESKNAANVMRFDGPGKK